MSLPAGPQRRRPRVASLQNGRARAQRPSHRREKGTAKRPRRPRLLPIWKPASMGPTRTVAPAAARDQGGGQLPPRSGLPVRHAPKGTHQRRGHREGADASAAHNGGSAEALPTGRKPRTKTGSAGIPHIASLPPTGRSVCRCGDMPIRRFTQSTTSANRSRVRLIVAAGAAGRKHQPGAPRADCIG